MKRLFPLLILAAFIAVATSCKGKARRLVEGPLEQEVDETALAGGEYAPPASEARKFETAESSQDEGAALVLSTGSSADVLDLPAMRMIIKTAALSVRVKDVDAAYDRTVQLVEESGGYILSGTISESEGARADITIKVHPKGFTSLISKLENLGTVEYKSISGEDVTEEYFDLKAELATQLALKARLFELLKKAKNVEEAIMVEQELQRVDYNVNRIKGRMKYLEQMVTESTITLTIYTDTYTPKTPFINWQRIGNGFKTAAKILVHILFGLLQVLVVLIPLAALAGLITWLVIRIIRKRKKKKTGT